MLLLTLLTKTAGLAGVRLKAEAVTANKSGEANLFLHGRSDARHTLIPVRRRRQIRVNQTKLCSVLAENSQINCIKMDIEGSELEMLQSLLLPARIRCLVFEYSFSVDARVSVFKKTISHLKGLSANVKYPPSALNRPKSDNGKEVRCSNRDIVVHCWGRR